MALVGRILIVVAVLVAAGVCVSFGRWQLDRWDETKQANAQLEERLAGEVVAVHDASGAEPPADKVRVRGRFDTQHHVVLRPRSHRGSPGVHVVTPFFLEGGGAVMVNRGWVYAADSRTAYPEQFDESASRELTGMAQPIGRGVDDPPWSLLDADSSLVWSARTMDLDSLTSRLPFAVAAWYIQELPGEGVPAEPSRFVPAGADEMTHVSYAIQWFLFASIILVGPWIVVWSRRRRGAGPAAPPPDREVPVS